MLPYLEALNPSRCCFTASDFDDALLDIDAIIKQFDSKKNEGSYFHNKAEKKVLLEKAYYLAIRCLDLSGKSKPDKQLIFLIADILQYYGKICYEENFFASKQILLASINLHFYAIGLLDCCFDMQEFPSLEDLKIQSCAKAHHFDVMERLILTTHTDQCLVQVRSHTLAQSYPSRRMLSIAAAARWLGHCYQKLEPYHELLPENDRRFDQLFNLGESLLLLIDTDESKKELADLYCQAWPFMYQRQHPHEFEEICALYNKALACDNSLEMQLRVANLRFWTLFNADKKKQAIPYMMEALDLAGKINMTSRNKHLILSVHNNYALYLLSPESIDIEKAGYHLSIASEIVSECRSKGEDHLNFGICDMHLALYNFLLGEFAISLAAINRAIATLKKYPDYVYEYLIKAESLQSIIKKALLPSCLPKRL